MTSIVRGLEANFYRQLFDEGSDGFQISGQKAAEILQLTGLSRKQLHEIWSLADSENEGKLDFSGFCIAARLCAHAQNGLPVTTDLVHVEPKIPLQLVTQSSGSGPLGSSAQNNPNGVPNGVGAATAQGAGVNSAQGANFDWRTRDGDLESYTKVFRENCPSGFCEGQEARKIFTKAGLSQRDLSLIWDLSDCDCDGRLSVKEFCIAMHLLTCVHKFGVAIPTTLPPELMPANLNLPSSVPLSRNNSPKPGSRQNSPNQVYAAPQSVMSQSAMPGIMPQAASQVASGIPQTANERVLAGLPPDLQGSQGNTGVMLDRAWRAEARIQNTELNSGEIEFLEERLEMENQMRRRREFERSISMLRTQIEDVEQHKQTQQVENAKLTQTLENLMQNSEKYRETIGQLESDIFLLSEIGNQDDLNSQSAANGGAGNGGSARQEILDPDVLNAGSFEEFRRKVLHNVKMELEMRRIQRKKIDETRVRLSQAARENKKLDRKNAVLLEKFRQMEQDRTLLLTSVESDRSKLLMLREDRIKLLEERCELRAKDAKLKETLAHKPSYLQKSNRKQDGGFLGNSSFEESFAGATRGVAGQGVVPGSGMQQHTPSGILSSEAGGRVAGGGLISNLQGGPHQGQAGNKAWASFGGSASTLDGKPAWTNNFQSGTPGGKWEMFKNQAA